MIRLLFTLALSTVAANASLSLLHGNAAAPNYPTNDQGKIVVLVGSHTWNSFQDTDESATPAAFNFDAYVTNLVFWGHTCTILWRKDIPAYKNWGNAGGSPGSWQMTPWPWKRVGPGNATDGLLKFDFTQFNQAYFDRLRARVIELGTNNLYAIVELFDGLGLLNYRGSTDGYPFTGANNVNSIDDGYTSGSSGPASMTMGSLNAINTVQDNYVSNVVFQLKDLSNIVYEVSEEAPDTSTFWQAHMIDLVHALDLTNNLQHPVLWPTLDLNGGSATDSQLYNSKADIVAPQARISPTTSCGSSTPACKININDSDHSYFGMWNDTQQQNRAYGWTNICNANHLVFMDPYTIQWNGRNNPLNPVNGVGTAPTNYWNNLRFNMGQMAKYVGKFVNVPAASSASSTGNCLASTVVNSNQFLIYASAGGSFTVNLSTASGKVIVGEWYDPNALTTTTATAVNGGSSSQSFTTPGGFAADSVLFLQDAQLTNSPAASSIAFTSGSVNTSTGSTTWGQ